MKKIVTITLALMANFISIGQEMKLVDGLPFYEVPEYTVDYTANTVAARMIDGLGFRYRWATEGLTSENLDYRPSEGARSLGETIDHILGLSRVIVNSTLKTPTDFTEQQPALDYEGKRQKTLENLMTARENLIKGVNINEMKIEFKSNNGNSEYPFWNQINGPIADALWHSGQVVTLRRSAGNPLPKGVQFLQGKIRK